MGNWTLAGVIFCALGVISFVVAANYYFGGLSLIVVPMITGIIFLALGLYMVYLDRDTPYAG